MAFAIHEITAYVIKSGSNVSFGGQTPNCRGFIACAGPKIWIQFYFLPGADIPDPVLSRLDPALVDVFMPLDLMPVMIDMLRKESPIFAVLSNSYPRHYVYLTTDAEAAGEEEGI